MKNILLLIFIVTTIDLSADSWTQKANIPASLSRGASGFSIGNNGYICGGLDTVLNYSKALWEYDPVTNAWTQKADYGGGLISYLVTFVIQGKAYAGIGIYPSFRKDWWQYDPTTNIWTQKADYGGGKIVGSYAFAANNLGYVCGGQDSSYILRNDLWEYNPVSDVWSPKTSSPILPSEMGISFSINNKGYIGGGANSTVAQYTTTFWEYNPLTDSWSQKANIPASQFVQSGAFSIGNYGYVTGGESPYGYYNNLWQYNPTLNQWVSKATFPGNGRDEFATLSIGNTGYAGAGGQDGVPGYNDFWAYTPDSSEMISVNETADYQRTINVYPNPFSTQTVLRTDYLLHNATLSVDNCFGQTVKKIKNISGQTVTFSRDNLPSGLYFIRLTQDNKILATDKLVITD